MLKQAGLQLSKTRGLSRGQGDVWIRTLSRGSVWPDGFNVVAGGCLNLRQVIQGRAEEEERLQPSMLNHQEQIFLQVVQTSQSCSRFCGLFHLQDEQQTSCPLVSKGLSLLTHVGPGCCYGCTEVKLTRFSPCGGGEAEELQHLTETSPGLHGTSDVSPSFWFNHSSTASSDPHSKLSSHTFL